MSAIPKQNYPIDCQQPHAELLDVESGTVWQSLLPMDRDTYRALALPETVLRIGLGQGVMDEHYFRQSPGAAAAGPVTQREIAGFQWIHCANPPADFADVLAADGPARLLVDKHHSLVFAAGRDVTALRNPDGARYIQVIAPRRDSSPVANASEEPGLAGFPEGWTAVTVHFHTRTSVHLPNPTEAWFLSDGSSYQGPLLDLPEEA